MGEHGAGLMTNIAHATQLLLYGNELLCENRGGVGWGGANDNRCTCYATVEVKTVHSAVAKKSLRRFPHLPPVRLKVH